MYYLIYCESYLLIVAACVCSFVSLFLSCFGGEIPTLSLKTAVSLMSNQTNAGRHFMHGSWFQRNLTTNHPESKLALPSWLNRGGEGRTTSLALIPARTYIHHWFVLIGTKRISVHHPHPQWLLSHLTRPHTHLQKCERAHKCLPLHLSRTHTHTHMHMQSTLSCHAYDYSHRVLEGRHRHRHKGRCHRHCS